MSSPKSNHLLNALVNRATSKTGPWVRRKPVGIYTGKRSSVGRPVYLVIDKNTGNKERMSEQGVSIPLHPDHAWLNAPSIHDGKRLTEREVKKRWHEGKINESEWDIILGDHLDAIEASKARSDKL